MPHVQLHMIRAVLLVASLAPALAAAQDYPTRPIRLVVGFAAGGPTDIPARYVADKLTDMLGQRVVVENKPAAAGMVATRDVLAQPRDGYTLLLCTHFEAINTAIYRHPGFALADLAPISLISKYYYGLVLADSIPATDVASFVRYAKAHPGDVRYATIGAGSAQEIFAHQLERLAGISMTKVPYRSGPMALQDLIPGRIQFYVSPVIGIIAQARAKQLKLIGVSSAERLAAVPETPTLREQGIDFVRFGWLGICAGTGTPPAVITKLNHAISTIVASPDYQQVTAKAGSIPQSSSPDELRKTIEQTRADVEGTIREFGLQQD
ncbi:MAG TPA: tripartite tricarboxylate transporter substrate binding protein [Xanthobacteraceae bacterium]|nr:tripartite tricarboxylate transporter substrate binding protein [Xanthobacteraceae bacterium]